jgi:hypothetical protein
LNFDEGFCRALALNCGYKEPVFDFNAGNGISSLD